RGALRQRRCGRHDLSGFHRHADDRRQSLSNAVPDACGRCGTQDCACDRAQEALLRIAVADELGGARAEDRAAAALRPAGCAPAAQTADHGLTSLPVEANPTNVDWLGVAHSPAGDAPRIASLVPSLTELLFALALGPYVVART